MLSFQSVKKEFSDTVQRKSGNGSHKGRKLSCREDEKMEADRYLRLGGVCGVIYLFLRVGVVVVGGGMTCRMSQSSCSITSLSRGLTSSIIFIDLDSDRCRPLLYFTPILLMFTTHSYSHHTLIIIIMYTIF